MSRSHHKRPLAKHESVSLRVVMTGEIFQNVLTYRAWLRVSVVVAEELDGAGAHATRTTASPSDRRCIAFYEERATYCILGA